MKKSIWLMGITAGAALGAAAFMPSKASAGCCRSAWSTSVTNDHWGPEECGIHKGYITNGIQYTTFAYANVERKVGFDSVYADVTPSFFGGGTSPGARVRGVCNNQQVWDVPIQLDRGSG